MQHEETELLLSRVRAGKSDAIDELLGSHRDQLRRMIRVRLHPKVRSRVDESDIIQEVLLDAGQRVDEYFRDCEMPFSVWLRYIAEQKIKQCHRFHLDAQKRNAKREFPLLQADDSLSGVMAFQIAESGDGPATTLQKSEQMEQVAAVLETLKPIDREVICMRHFEQMENADVAIALEIDPSTCSSRYLRALVRLKAGLEKIPGVQI